MGSLDSSLTKHKHTQKTHARRHAVSRSNKPHIMRGLISSRLTRALRFSQQRRAISQKDLAAQRNYVQEIESTTGNMYKMAYPRHDNCVGTYPANEPLQWDGVIPFAGLGGFWTTPCRPVVFFAMFLFVNFLYQWNFCKAEIEDACEGAAEIAGVEGGFPRSYRAKED